MENTSSPYRQYIYAACLGAVGGGIFVAIATRAIPKIMSKMMAGMMQNMMAEMGAGECEPIDI